MASSLLENHALTAVRIVVSSKEGAGVERAIDDRKAPSRTLRRHDEDRYISLK
jgi:hypothetical protein